MAKTAEGATQEFSVAETIAINLGHLLKEERWSARQAAFALGLTPMYVSRRVSGEVECTGTDLATFAGHLGVPVERFFEPIDPETLSKDYGSDDWPEEWPVVSILDRLSHRGNADRGTYAPVTPIGA